MNDLNNLVSVVQDIQTLSTYDIEKSVSNMISITKDYIEANKLESLVIGVSGGLDSATVAAILQEKHTGVPLIGISIPMSSSDAHKEQAQWVGDNYCSVFEEFQGWEQSPNDYDDDHLIGIIDSTVAGTDRLAVQAGFNIHNFPHWVLQGNIKARLRMITLYDLARKTNGMVLSTDNLSEYLAGFWTINGDVGDWGIIQNIWKGFELPQIAKHVGVREDIITQKPSDGLSVTEDDTDEAQLGMTYQEFDTIMSIHTKQLNIDNISLAQLFHQLHSIDCYSEDGKKILAAIDRLSGTTYKRVGTVNLTRDEIFK